MVPNLSLPNLNLAALAGLTQGNVGMFNMPSTAPVVPPVPVVAPMATPVAPVAPTAPVAPPVASTASTAPPVDLSKVLSNLNLEAIAGASGMMGVPGATSSTITNPYTPAYVFNPDVSLVGATDIFGGRTYESPLATPGKTRVGYSEMLKLNQAPGYVATNRPEQIGDMYLPFRPSGEGAQVADDIKTWYEYYTDNEDFRKYLSADEQTELAWLDYRNDRYTQEAFTKKINDIREQFNLPQKVGFKDFEAHFSYGTKRKKYSDNPYADLQQYGPSIGGYWNPENDPSEFQQAMANPLVGAVTATLGAALGGPIGAAIAGGATSKLSGADWSDALKAAAISGGTAYLGGKLAGPSSAPVGEFNIPGVNLGAAPVSQFNRELITNSLLSPTAASAIANPALNLAAPSFFQTALGQGLGKAGVALASGGDLKDALTAGVLGYAGTPGGLLSGTLGDTLGLDLGTSTLAKGVEGLNLADALKFGIKLPQDQWSAVGGVLGDMNLGTVGQSGVLGSLPPSLQNIVENVKVSDLLANIGGPSTSSLFNIVSDINVPSLNLPNFNLPGTELNLPPVPEWLKNAYENVEGTIQKAAEAVEGVVQPVAQQIERGAGKAYDATEQAIQDAVSAITPANPGSIFNIPKVDLFDSTTKVPELNIQTPNLDLQKLFAGLSGAGMLARPQQEARSSSSPEYKPFMAQVAYDPGLPQFTPIAYSDPLSVLLAEFYKL